MHRIALISVAVFTDFISELKTKLAKPWQIILHFDTAWFERKYLSLMYPINTVYAKYFAVVVLSYYCCNVRFHINLFPNTEFLH